MPLLLTTFILMKNTYIQVPSLIALSTVYTKGKALSLLAAIREGYPSQHRTLIVSLGNYGAVFEGLRNISEYYNRHVEKSITKIFDVMSSDLRYIRMKSNTCQK